MSNWMKSIMEKLTSQILRLKMVSFKFKKKFKLFFETLEIDPEVEGNNVSLDSPVELIEQESSSNAAAAPVAPPRSIRRDGFRRTAVRHVDSVSLLDECQRQITSLSAHLVDSDEARDALLSLQQLFQRYKNTLSS